MKATQAKSERVRRILAATLLGGLAVALLVASGTFDVRIQWNDRDANAVDRPGSDEEAEPIRTAQASAADPFWRDDGGSEPIFPQGVPGGFADLADRASDGVVNIKTSSTVKGLKNAFESPVKEKVMGPPAEGAVRMRPIRLVLPA